MREVVWQTQALTDVLDIFLGDRRPARRIVDAVAQYEREGPIDIRALRGERGLLRIRVGDWRVILRLDADRAVLLRVRLRRDAHE